MTAGAEQIQNIVPLMVNDGIIVRINHPQGVQMEVLQMELGDGIKKFFLIGIGAAATSVEKSGEILSDLVKKGELTVEQGKALNQELRHNAEEKKKKFEEEKKQKNFTDFVSGLSTEDLVKLKEQIAQLENETAEAAEPEVDVAAAEEKEAE